MRNNSWIIDAVIRHNVQVPWPAADGTLYLGKVMADEFTSTELWLDGDGRIFGVVRIDAEYMQSDIPARSYIVGTFSPARALALWDVLTQVEVGYVARMARRARFAPRDH